MERVISNLSKELEKEEFNGRPESPSRAKSVEQTRNLWLGRLSLVLLILQFTFTSIVLRYSRVKAGPPYQASVVVLFNEVSKLLICLAVQLSKALSPAAENGTSLWHEYWKDMHNTLSHSLPMLLPAGLFIMQQTLQIIAATHLDAVAFQIFSQSFKLVPTAIFSYWLLGKHLSKMQWAAIPVLAMGVIIVTTANSSSDSSAATSKPGAVAIGFLVGILACSISGLSSAYAGVYFEKYLKGENAASLWVRNIQLGAFGVPLSAAYMVLKDGSKIRAGGMLQGFDASVWAVVALATCGGLVVGMVVKYCDNILKNFALAISVILTVIVVIPLFGQWPTPQFLVGVAVVLLSVFMYGQVFNMDTMGSCCPCFTMRPKGPSRSSSGQGLVPTLKIVKEEEFGRLVPLVMSPHRSGLK